MQPDSLLQSAFIPPTIGEEAVLSAAMQLKARRSTRKDLSQYIKWTLPRFSEQWFHRVMAKHLMKVLHGEIKRLIILAPPRHGKSETTSIRFPAMYLGNKPQNAVIGTSYALDLAQVFSRAVRDTLLGPESQRLFPVQLDILADTHWRIAGKDDKRYNYIAAGAGGGITGEGANLLLIDDPFKNYEEALSQTIRDRIWNWFTSVARTRLAPKAAIVIMMTPWHEDDLVHRLIRLAQEDKRADQWVILQLPAENTGEFEAKVWSTDGSVPTEVFPPYEALWPTQYDKEYLTSSRAVMGTIQYSAMYGCSPRAATGNLVKREWFNRWWVPPGVPVPKDATGLRPGYTFEKCMVLDPDNDKFDMIAQSWDLPFKDKKTNDFAAGHVYGARGRNDRFLLDRRCERMNYPTMKACILDWGTKRWKRADKVYIEDAASGPAILAELRDEVFGLTAVTPLGDKTQRFSPQTSTIESGHLWLPHPSIAPWIYDFIECLLTFPNALHDDDVDAYSQAMHKLRVSGRGLTGLIHEEMEARKVEAAKPADPRVQAQAEKNDMFRLPARKASGKETKRPEDVKACQHCGSESLAQAREFARCNECNKFTPKVMDRMVTAHA